MRNPTHTKELILKESSKLFNVQGYKATSLSDITKATKLTKGAIYSHFGSKAGLEEAALVYMTNEMLSKVHKQITQASNARDKVYAILEYFESYLSKPPIHGGCPLLNAAIEADDTNPNLQKVANRIMEYLFGAIVKILENGKRFKQIEAEADSHAFASLLFASIEGGVMMGKLSMSKRYFNPVMKHLKKELERILV